MFASLRSGSQPPPRSRRRSVRPPRRPRAGSPSSSRSKRCSPMGRCVAGRPSSWRAHRVVGPPRSGSRCSPRRRRRALVRCGRARRPRCRRDGRARGRPAPRRVRATTARRVGVGDRGAVRGRRRRAGASACARRAHRGAPAVARARDRAVVLVVLVEHRDDWPFPPMSASRSPRRPGAPRAGSSRVARGAAQSAVASIGRPLRASLWLPGAAGGIASRADGPPRRAVVPLAVEGGPRG